MNLLFGVLLADVKVLITETVLLTEFVTYALSRDMLTSIPTGSVPTASYISNYTDAVGDGIPSLRRVALINGPALQNQTLISGVSNLQVQFGVDVNNDEIIDRYVDPDDVAATDWSNVYAAKIWLLMRSDKKQKGMDTTKSFSIAGASAVNYGGVDDYRYFLVTSVVNLRNMKPI